MLSLDGKLWQHRMSWADRKPLPAALPPVAPSAPTGGAQLGDVSSSDVAKVAAAKALAEGEAWLHTATPVTGHEGRVAWFSSRDEGETQTAPISIGLAPPLVAPTATATASNNGVVGETQLLQRLRFSAEPRLYSLTEKFVRPVSEAAVAAREAKGGEDNLGKV